jgi:hypothetical protein
VRKIRNWHPKKCNDSQDQTGDGCEQRNPARKNTREKEQHDCARKR